VGCPIDDAGVPPVLSPCWRVQRLCGPGLVSGFHVGTDAGAPPHGLGAHSAPWCSGAGTCSCAGSPAVRAALRFGRCHESAQSYARSTGVLKSSPGVATGGHGVCQAVRGSVAWWVVSTTMGVSAWTVSSSDSGALPHAWSLGQEVSGSFVTWEASDESKSTGTILARVTAPGGGVESIGSSSQTYDVSSGTGPPADFGTAARAVGSRWVDRPERAGGPSGIHWFS
jgi:hypothetical protein